MANRLFRPQRHDFGRSSSQLLVAAWFASMVLVALVAVLLTDYFSGDQAQAPSSSAQKPPMITQRESAGSIPSSGGDGKDRGVRAESSPDTRIGSSPESDANADMPTASADGDQQPAADDSDARRATPAVAAASDQGAVADKMRWAGAEGLVPMPSMFANAPPSDSVAGWCRELATQVGSVAHDDCMNGAFKDTGHRSVDGRPMIVGDIPASSRPAMGRVLLISATHGDEPSSIGTAFRWIKLMATRGTDYKWNVVPTLNPDGVLHKPATRVNANGVDLNRNLSTTNWARESRDYWRRVGFEKRRFPGEKAGSEPENRWLAEEIRTFKPNVIISLHAPYGVLDYDGKFPPPQKLGDLNLHRLGVYPGSLGNFASHMRGIPVITVELDDAREPPGQDEIETMWGDLNGWLDRYFRNVRQAQAGSPNDAG